MSAEGESTSGDAASEGADFTIVRGAPSDDEIAALAVVLDVVLRQERDAGRASAPRSRWSDRRLGLRGPVASGPDGWRDSGRVFR